VAVEELAEASEDSTADALVRLRRGALDAVLLTSTLPSRALQDFAVTPGLRLLPVTDAALEQLVADHPGLARITLPPNTYPQQREAIVGVATMALLVTTADAPTSEVERVVEVVSTRVAPQRARPASGEDVARVAAQTELRGVTIPLHPGASSLQSGTPRPLQ
jgi:TRAP-type uncharacterized transport system substrate-binding protein